MSVWTETVMRPTKGTFADLEERVDSGEITREEAEEIKEQRFVRAGGYEPEYDEMGWPMDMKNW